MHTPPFQRSIGRAAAIALADRGWWKGHPARDVALFQLRVKELTMPFDTFHGVIEEALGRSVWTHEMAKAEALFQELVGERDAPTWRQIVEQIAASKLIGIDVD